jgi:hypothetical protein
MRQSRILTTAALAMALGGALWATHMDAKTKGGCTGTQICCRYMKEGATALDCMEPKACAAAGGKEVPNKAMCAE